MKQNTKIITKITAVCAAAALVSGCLEATYYTQANPDTFFENKEKVNQRFVRPFTHWRSTVSYVRAGTKFMEEFSTDELCMPVRSDYNWLDGSIYIFPYWHHFTPDMEGYLDGAWSSWARGVAETWDCKGDLLGLDLIEGIGYTQDEVDIMFAQLDALAANFYMSGLALFGGVPLYSVEDVKNHILKPRSSEQETFDYIEQLLKDAIPNLPKKNGTDGVNGMLNQAAGAVLLARLYFNAHAWVRDEDGNPAGVDRIADCKTICDELMAGVYGNYSLAGDFKEIFGWNNEKCPETIMGIPSQSTVSTLAGNYEHSLYPATTNYLRYWLFVGSSPTDIGPWNGFCLTPSLDADSLSLIEGRPDLNYAGQTRPAQSPKATRLGSPFGKFEDTDLRKQPYKYKGNGEYEGMFIMGPLINRAADYGYTGQEKGDTVWGESWDKKKIVLTMPDQIARLDLAPSNPKYGEEGIRHAAENSGIRIMKYSPVPWQTESSYYGEPDVPIIRYAEVYYMLAECKLRQGDKSGAASLINDVRKRYFVGGADPNPVTFAGSDEDNKYRMLDEWMIEFLSEGRRRTDLLRWNLYASADAKWFDFPNLDPTEGNPDYANPMYNRLPIPRPVRQANPEVLQNKGYPD